MLESGAPPLEPVPQPILGLPEWIEPTFDFKAGADPLGFQTITTDRTIGRLLPGILALSQRARYFSVYSFFLRRYADQKRTPTNAALSRYMLAREYEYALAVLLCPNRCGSGPNGARAAGRATGQARAVYERGESVESTLGGYGLYYQTPMRQLGLVATAGAMLGDAPTRVDVLRPDSPRAQRLAEAFGHAIARTRYLTEGHIDGTDPIPADVLVEYAGVACLCRLVDWPEERGLLREVMLEPDPALDPIEVATRREGVALYLDRLSADERVLTFDGGLRHSVWTAFSADQTQVGTPMSRALARWAAVAVTHWAQMGLSLIWVGAGPAMRSADQGDGLSNADLDAVVQQIAHATLPLGGETLQASPEMATSDFDAAVRAVRGAWSPGELISDLRGAGTAVAGLALLLSVRASLPDNERTDPGWIEYGSIDGEWQPSLLRLMRFLDEHMAEEPNISQTLRWLLDHFVIRTHERIAYSKLPEFTFRFRWEVGRLRFYDHPFGWTDPGNIRARTLGSLTADLGFWERAGASVRLTQSGSTFVAEVLAP